jgi:cystinosin
MRSVALLLLVLVPLSIARENIPLHTSAETVEVILHQTATVTYTYSGNLTAPLHLSFNTSNNLLLDPPTLTISPSEKSADLHITGVSVTSRTLIDIHDCWIGTNTTCPFNKSEVFISVAVAHSRAISILVTVTGWIYFVAWSISFYPQIWLNFQRKSVEGLNFDFLLLNVIGFACYTVYNVFMFFDDDVQDLYLKANPRSLIPVLLNDVVFAAHALLACIITGLQCFIYERANQRISHVCKGWSSVLILFSIGSFIATLFHALNFYGFIKMLSYVKMAVTLSKYFPQAILNFRRKSTIGWSIGNVLLDFCGGSMDILQMVLQASNTDDWSGFYGNPVKFGLGLVSIIFDVLFMIQHYVLYRHSSPELEATMYDQVETSGETTSSSLENFPENVDESDRRRI